jgi:RNA polymerase sigma-B factor
MERILVLVGDQDSQVSASVRRHDDLAIDWKGVEPSDPLDPVPRPCAPARTLFPECAVGVESINDRSGEKRPQGDGTAYPAATEDRVARAKEDRRLLVRYHREGDPAAREALVERFLPLARQLARRYQRGGEQLDDLVQVASLGLLKAVDRFDPARETAFSSFAVPTILGELKRHFRDKGWSVRVPRDLQELAVKVDRVADEMSRELGRAPTPAEIAERTGTTLEQVLEAREASAAYRAVSLDRPRTDDEEDGDSYADAVGVEDPGYRIAEASATVERLMAVLSDREREVLRLRFEEDLTQSEIGARVGVSQMHVSRLIRQSIARLREEAAEPD